MALTFFLHFTLGNNGILALGGLTINGQQKVNFGVVGTFLSAAASSMTTIDERNFSMSPDPDLFLIKVTT